MIKTACCTRRVPSTHANPSFPITTNSAMNAAVRVGKRLRVVGAVAIGLRWKTGGPSHLEGHKGVELPLTALQPPLPKCGGCIGR